MIPLCGPGQSRPIAKFIRWDCKKSGALTSFKRRHLCDYCRIPHGDCAARLSVLLATAWRYNRRAGVKKKPGAHFCWLSRLRVQLHAAYGSVNGEREVSVSRAKFSGGIIRLRPSGVIAFCGATAEVTFRHSLACRKCAVRWKVRKWRVRHAQAYVGSGRKEAPASSRSRHFSRKCDTFEVRRWHANRPFLSRNSRRCSRFSLNARRWFYRDLPPSDSAALRPAHQTHKGLNENCATNCPCGISVQWGTRTQLTQLHVRLFPCFYTYNEISINP